MSKRSIMIITALVIIITGSLIFYFFGNSSKGEIRPSAEWRSILKDSKWNFHYSEDRDYNRWDHKGTVAFDDSENYVFHVSITQDQGVMGDDKYGGQIRGQYNVEEKLLALNSEKCDIQTEFSPNPEVCKFYQSIILDESGDGDYELKIMSFNHDKIVFEGKKYSIGSNVKFSFYRIK